jgi:uncharacterized protein (TIGR01244 family)
MDIRKISDDYSVTGQISASDIPAIREAGFKSVICNRPDDEHPGEAAADEVRAAAEAAGLEFRYIPVISGAMTADNVSDQAAALDQLSAPVLAYCRSGTRCTNLYSYIQQAKG